MPPASTTRRRVLALMRPVYAPKTPKHALVDSFEAFAAQRRRDYEQRDELEDDE